MVYYVRMINEQCGRVGNWPTREAAEEAERREEEAGEEATVAERERCEERAALETR